jgi:hypothetical protein
MNPHLFSLNDLQFTPGVPSITNKIRKTVAQNSNIDTWNIDSAMSQQESKSINSTLLIASKNQASYTY